MPVRIAPVFSATIIVTLPDPVPVAGEANVIHGLVVWATHEHPEPSVTAIVLEVLLDGKDDCAADAASHRTRARQMLAVGAPFGRSDQKYSVCASPLTAGWLSTPLELIAPKFTAPPNGDAGVSRVANQTSMLPRPPARSDSKYSERPSTLSSGLPSRVDELMLESGWGAENVPVRVVRAAIQMSAPPMPPARSESNAILTSSDVSDGDAAFDVGRFSSVIADGVPNAAVGVLRIDVKMSARDPPLARVELKYIRSRSDDSHGRACDSPGIPVVSGVISPTPLSRNTLYWPRPSRSSSDTCHPGHHMPVTVVNPVPLSIAFIHAPVAAL